MRRPTRALCSAALVVLITACGGSTTSTTTAHAPTTGTNRAAPGPTVFPLTITRVGGIAGFRDVLVVAGDGLVSVMRKGQQNWQCRLTPGAVGRVATAAADVPWQGMATASPLPSFPDDLVSLVRSPSGGPVRLEDPRVGAGSRVFQELLNDINAGPAAARMCVAV